MSMWWKKRQQATGWPWGPGGTIVLVLVVVFGLLWLLSKL